MVLNVEKYENGGLESRRFVEYDTVTNREAGKRSLARAVDI